MVYYSLACIPLGYNGRVLSQGLLLFRQLHESTLLF